MTILIPKYREIYRDIFAPEYRASGHFRFTARSARYKGERYLGETKNLILDQGLLRLIGGGGISSGYVQLGTGITAPANGQTSLVTYVSSISNFQSQVDSYVVGPPPYTQTVREYRGTVGGNTGTFYEVGLGWASVGSLLSRALILDGGGSPNPITVLSDEQLSVYYTFRWYPPTTDATGTITVNGSNYDWTARAAGISYAPQAEQLLSYGILGYRGIPYADLVYPAASTLGTITGDPSGVAIPSTAASTAYTSPNTYGEFISTFNPTVVPAGGVGAMATRIYASSGGPTRGIQVSFTPPLPKTGTQTLTITTRASIARYP
jgi:hypothetical protein